MDKNNIFRSSKNENETLMNIYPKAPKRIVFFLMSIFLLYQSTRLGNLLFEVGNLHWGLQVLFAFLINLFFTGVFALAGFALPTEKLMPQKYYIIHHPKKLKLWFQKLGVEAFRNFLLATVWKKKEMQKDYFNGTVDGIASFEQKTKKSEFGHLLPLIVITIFCVFLIKTKMWILIIVTMIINIIFNFYPIPLQRHHRMRLLRLKKIMERKQRK